METFKIISNNPESIRYLFLSLMGIYIVSTLLEILTINKRKVFFEEHLAMLKRGKEEARKKREEAQ